MPAVSFQDLPIVDGAWSRSDLDAVLGDPPDWARFQKAHVWSQSGTPEIRGGYKVPIAKMEGGKLVVVRQKVFDAMAAINGSRTPLDVSPAERKAMYDHVAKYYAKMDRPAPPFKSSAEIDDEREREMFNSATEANDLPDGHVSLMNELSLGEGDEGPPKEFELLKRGDNMMRKGGRIFRLSFDSKSADGVADTQKAKGRKDLPIDYDHGMLSIVSGPDSGSAAGWFTPEVRSGALWATNVEWTKRAAEHLSNREYRYFSVAVGVEETNEVGRLRVTELINFALTNLPAAVGQKPLAADDKETETMTVKKQDDPKPTGQQTDPPAGDPPTTPTPIQAKLGATDDAEATVKLDELVASGATLSAIRQALGLSEIDDVVQSVKALSTKAKVADDLVERVASLEADKEKDAWQHVFDQGVADGKLPESLHEWAKGEPSAKLSAYLDKAPVVQTSGRIQPSASPTGTYVPTPEEISICNQMGMSIEDYVKERAKRLGAKN